jgi:hypothetical protein
MRIQAYLQHSGAITITVATARAEPMASTRFTAAKIHEDYAAHIRTLMTEHRHTNTTASLLYPASKRISTYLPTLNGDQLFSITELQPAGAPRDIDDNWQLEIMRIRYAVTLNLTPAAFLTPDSDAMERHLTYAVQRLLVNNGVANVYLPGDEVVRSGTGTDVDVACEMAASGGRGPVEIPHPAQA